MNQTVYNQISQVLYSNLETQKNSYDIAKYVVDNNIKGDIIECGVAMAGNFATMILGAKGKGRTFWGFDSFQRTLNGKQRPSHSHNLRD